MTDGPLKNTKLGRNWKRLVEAVQNDAVDQTELIALANDSIACELVTPDNTAALKALEAYGQRKQMDLDPVSSVETEFEKHRKTSFNNRLQKELSYRLGDGVTAEDALPGAVEASVTSHIGKAKNSFQEERTSLRERKKLSAEKCQSNIKKFNAALDAANITEIRAAIYGGKKKAFKAATNKKKGLDEGPGL